MSGLTRRDVMVGLAGASLAAMGQAQDVMVGEGGLGKARVLDPQAGMAKAASGAERWNGPQGKLATGEAVGMHVSVVPAGTPPPALHRISHSELLVVVEGTLEYHHDEVVERAEAGSILYVPYGTMHFVKNAGAGTARYVVLQIGGDTKTS